MNVVNTLKQLNLCLAILTTGHEQPNNADITYFHRHSFVCS